MKPFIHEDFLLENDCARTLYHDHAERMPIIDYHNHLSPQMIAEDYHFATITELWLGGDHYKWRALRANGIPEELITGNAPDREKFRAWARTLPHTMRNPLYHWTQLELKRYFGIEELLCEENADEIYDKCNEMLAQPEFSVRNLLLRMNVEVLCTTDDPVDSLEYHRCIAESGFAVKVLPTWRPDKLLNTSDSAGINEYIDRLAEVSGVKIDDFESLLTALRVRQKFFAEHGCRLSDHGVSYVPNAEFDEHSTHRLFKQLRSGVILNEQESESLRGGILYYLLQLNAEMGWAQQLHIGAIRNNNLRLFKSLGPDVGCDSIADGNVAEGLSRIFGRLDEQGVLTRTILYNLNPKDSEVLATMAYNFNDGSQVGKMQYGAAWWFLDQMDGMVKQLNAISSLGLLSRFVGMLTDSRSFVSYPRHEYFRRILCNLLGREVESGLLPVSEMERIGRMVEDVSYNNAKRYFGF
ncbi:MAG: glucuronate isomerase [Rikenellaceae bacterium]|nr:glucuronate isomerase [Rikenellaceae bacterium]MBQ3260509.1 glucuronate isomerase [Alistipes sp.]